MAIPVINKMPDETFASICDSGTGLVRELMEILKEHGLEVEHALTVISVAAAGILRGTDMTPEDLVMTINRILPMWSVEVQDGNRGVRFDPVSTPMRYPARSSTRRA